MRDTLIIYTAYKEKFSLLTDEQFGRLVRLMIDYQESGEVPEVNDIVVKLSFDVVKVDIDKNNEKYEKVVQRNKENGKKGGRPKNPENPVGFLETQQNPKNPDEPKKADNDNDNDNVTFRKSNKTIKRYSDNDELNKAILDFIEHRKKLRSPMTEKAIELFIKKLQSLSATTAGQIELINTAIMKGWKSVYPSSEPAPTAPKKSSKLRALEGYYLNGGD